MNPYEIKKMMSLTKTYSFIFGSRYLPNAGSEDDSIITFVGNRFFQEVGNIFWIKNFRYFIYLRNWSN